MILGLMTADADDVLTSLSGNAYMGRQMSEEKRKSNKFQ